jgi:hypothetical protein
MAILKSKDGKELLVSCTCGCESGVKFKIDNEDEDFYCFMTYINSTFYTEQCEGMWRVFRKKLKKILAIIRNKDFHYTDTYLTKAEFKEFKEYINSIG